MQLPPSPDSQAGWGTLENTGRPQPWVWRPTRPQMWVRVYKPARGLTLFLQSLNFVCFLITLATVVGSVASGGGGEGSGGRGPRWMGPGAERQGLRSHAPALCLHGAGADHRQLDRL